MCRFTAIAGGAVGFGVGVGVLFINVSFSSSTLLFFIYLRFSLVLHVHVFLCHLLFPFLDFFYPVPPFPFPCPFTHSLLFTHSPLYFVFPFLFSLLVSVLRIARLAILLSIAASQSEPHTWSLSLLDVVLELLKCIPAYQRSSSTWIRAGFHAFAVD